MTDVLAATDPFADPFASPSDEQEIMDSADAFVKVADMVGFAMAIIPTVIELVDNVFFDGEKPEGETNRKQVERITADLAIFGEQVIKQDGKVLARYKPDEHGVITASGVFFNQTKLVAQLRSYVGGGMLLAMLIKDGRSYKLVDANKAQRSQALAWWNRRNDAPPM